ncbi:sulfatase [Pasteurellaceae bacterium Macca]|nr:sulfatase [Pasteurellaceae bacterium Macca]
MRRVYVKSKFILTVPVLLLAYQSASATMWEEKFYNPKVLPDSVILPMPCDGAMAFRVIKTGTKHPLEDQSILLGSDSSEADAFAEHATPNYIAGSFEQKGERYFLLAQYEVSELQYKAVMGETCPTTSMKLRLPQTNISWFDAVQFANKYSEWLMKNHADKLPKEDGKMGFLRLPTNAEGEFAARGGVAVSSSQFREKTFPMADGIGKYVWFAGPSSANGKLQITGLKAPNPLGLFDVLGNANEMVFDSFKMNKLDRYHGQAGGMTIRGGSYISAENQISSSFRAEAPYYNDDGQAYKAKDLGFRVALVAPITTSSERSKLLDKEWHALGKESDKDQEIAKNFQTLSSNVENEELKKQLKTLENQVLASNQAKDEQRDQAVRSSLELGAFLCTNLNELDQVNRKNQNIAKKYCQLLGTAGEASDKERCANFEEKAKVSQAALDFSATYYADTIVNSTKTYEKNVMLKQKESVKAKLNNQHKSNLADYVDRFWLHLDNYYGTGKIERSKWIEQCAKN